MPCRGGGGGGGLRLGRTNTSDAEASFMDLHFTISSGAVSAGVRDGLDDFNFEIMNFPFIDDDDVPHSASGKGLCFSACPVYWGIWLCC